MFDVAVDGPLEYVKECLKVSFQFFPTLGLTVVDKSNKSNASIVSSCFDRVAELQNQGFSESDIRGVAGTAYIGEVPSLFEWSHLP